MEDKSDKKAIFISSDQFNMDVLSHALLNVQKKNKLDTALELPLGKAADLLVAFVNTLKTGFAHPPGVRT